MNTREKRTQTAPGLGQVKGTDRAEPQSSPPISGPPASAGPRHTKALEPQRRPSREQPSTQPQPQPPPVSETPAPPRATESSRALSRDEEGSQSGMQDTPFDHLDRLDKIRRAPTLREEGSETPRAGGVASTPPSPPARRSQRPIEGRPVSNRPSRAPEPRALSSKPPKRSSMPPASGRGGVRSSVRPPKLPGSAPPSGGGGANVKKSARASIRIDDVGSVRPDAVHSSHRQVPKLLKSKDEIAAAPIDNRAGFLLTYIDGSTSVQGLVDMAVMPEEEVHEILDRLRRLGIIALR